MDNCRCRFLAIRRRFLWLVLAICWAVRGKARRRSSGVWCGSSGMVLAREFAGAGLHAPDFELGAWGLHSQHGEDACTLDLFRRLGAPRKTFLEIGIQDGLECNTAILALNLGWRGVMLEGDRDLAKEAQTNYREFPGVTIRQAFVLRENINILLKETGVDKESDFFSLDIDGNDYWIWAAMEDFRPRVVAVECNGYFGRRAVTIPYDPRFVHRAKTPRGYCGASLPAFVKLARQKGYALVRMVSCNAYFVRRDVLAGGVQEIDADVLPLPDTEDPKIARILRGLQGLELVEV
jgi:hypothetical protein